MAVLFISYAREDERACSALASALEKEGHKVWWDRRLTLGAEYSREIEDALNASEKVIVLWSERSKNSAWVRDEAGAALAGGKIIPVTIDGTEPPLGFRQFHSIDLSGWLSQSGSKLPENLVRSINGDIELDTPSEADQDQSPRRDQRIAFARTPDGVSLAFSRMGAGPALMKAGNGYNHLEYELENPLWRHWHLALSESHSLVRYDQRGTGMSDRDIPALSFNLLVEDLGTVADSAQLETFDLFGISQGAPLAIAFAAKHPERVRRLVVVNGFPMGWRYSTNSDRVASWEALSVLARSGKSTPGLGSLFANQYFPNATRSQVEWWNKIQEESASPEIAYRYFDLLGDINVLPLLDNVQAKTLVMHSKGDQVVPFEAGPILASRIPGAEFVALEGENHLPQTLDPGWPQILNELRRFLDSS